jgi:aminocarboxymuconate-semialdehyde decarboxylase
VTLHIGREDFVVAKSSKKATRKAAKKAPKKAARKVTRKAAKAVAAKRRAKKVGRRGRTPKPVVIDVHSHIVVPELLAFARSNSLFAQAAPHAGGRADGLAEPLYQRMSDNKLRLKDMDAMGIDMQVISPSILQQCVYFADPGKALEMERLGNDRVAESVAEHPDRLIGLGSVPMQDAKLAAQELERCVRTLGLKGVIIGSLVNGRELGEEQFRPFWAKAEALGATVFIHPAGSPDQRMRKHRLLITLGQPLEEAFAMLSLVYEGIMDAYPKVKILVAHGGGFVPFYAGRFDNAYRNGHRMQMKGDVSSYLRRFYYDTVIFNPDMLDYLATKVPANRIMLATDYPFAEKKPVEFVRRATRLSRKDQDGILGVNAAKLLGVSI